LSSQACCSRLAGSGRRRTSESQLWSCSLLSCTFAPERTRPRGTPFWSTTLCRLVPSFPRSVGFFPIFFPLHRSGDRLTVQNLPSPCDSLQIVIFPQAVNPHLAEHPLFSPVLEIAVSRRASVVLPRKHLPLTAGPQNVQNPIQNLSRLSRRPSLPSLSSPRLRNACLHGIPELVADVSPS